MFKYNNYSNCLEYDVINNINRGNKEREQRIEYTFTVKDTMYLLLSIIE